MQARLLARCAEGDLSAFTALYESSAPQLFAVLLRILNRRDLAEEALQDAFVSIWRHAASYRAQRSQPMTWMISIARYRAIDLKRAQRREVPLAAATAGESIDSEIIDTAADPSAEALRAQENSALADCMRELSDSPRECLRLAYLEGLTHQEIALKVNSPLGTVKSWIRRGLQALKECLER